LTSSTPPRTRAILYAGAFLAVAFWGASFAATKIALEQLSPASLVFIRTTIGMLVLALFALATRSTRVSLKVSWPQIMILGILGVAFHQWVQAQGLKSTSTTDTGWIIATIPIFVALLGWQFLGEQMSLTRVAGIGFGAFGVVLVISDGQALGFFKQLPDQLGNAFILLSAGNWAVFTVMSKRWLFGSSRPTSNTGLERKYAFSRMIQAMLRLMLIGWIVMLPWVAGEAPVRALGALSGKTIGALFFLGIACSGLAYIFWYAALTNLEATETSSLLYFEPLVTQAVAWFYLGEPLTLGIFIGGCAIMIGVWMVGRKGSGKRANILEPGPEPKPNRPKNTDHNQR
jgi:drug/metabolite transporter (DMT)-like permease